VEKVLKGKCNFQKSEHNINRIECLSLNLFICHVMVPYLTVVCWVS
jgi:hypothetical protein